MQLMADTGGRAAAGFRSAGTTRQPRCATAISRWSALARLRQRTAARTRPRCFALPHDLGHARLREKGSSAHLFVFRSTLVPGTVEDVLRPIIEAESGKKDWRRLPRVLPAGIPARGEHRSATTTSRRSPWSAPTRPGRWRSCASYSATCRAESFIRYVRARSGDGQVHLQ